MFGKALDSDAPVENVNQEKLLEDMREDGMKMRWSAWDLQDDPRVRKYATVEGDPKEKDPSQMLAGMSKEEKKKLLKKMYKKKKKL